MLSDARLDELLLQDAPHGDLTTEALGIGGLRGRIAFAARADMVVCCSEEAARMLERCGATVGAVTASGTALAAGEVFLTAEGPAAALHHAWKVAQTLVEYASGIATRTRRIVAAARAVAPGIAVACTRKNFPGTKDVAVRAVRAGGARMHRLGLSETLLVFPEHRAFLDPADGDWLRALKAREPERKVVVEVADAHDALDLLRAGADVLQLEKLAPDAVAAVVALTRDRVPPPVVAAAGGIDEGNAAAYAATGCAVLVTSAPFFARPSDVKVTLTAA
ncbi:ModD protein [Azospirillum sp. TSO22-1]|uniref:ModD protein n=1 Tax=Azospirillum sp. TSO22-1 TaxID=716789 RepID=UPI000D60F58E|nr:ModD protein [Azospirillum sp. TSO22-1]PWC31949.1 pyrophosphorylase [Azospirillum sp. TSO22-1]